MKFACAAVVSLVLVAPALAGPETESNGVKFECRLGGSEDQNFDILAENSGTTDKQCWASCTLGTAKGTTTFRRPESGTDTVAGRPGKQNFGSGPLSPGQADPGYGKLSSPDVQASCS